MIGRRTLIVASLMALLLLGVSGGVILAYWPPRGWAWMFAHEPRREIAYLNYWLATPLGFTTALLTFLAIQFFRRGKPVSPGQGRWMSGTLIGAGVLSIAVEAIRLAGLFAIRAQRAAHLAAGGSPHSFHFDPQFIILRIGFVGGGLFLAWMGNRMPKLLTPPADRPDRQNRAAMFRLGGWVFVIAGLGMAACAFVTPFQMAAAVYATIGLSSLMIWIVAACAYRFGGSPSRTASPS